MKRIASAKLSSMIVDRFSRLQVAAQRTGLAQYYFPRHVARVLAIVSVSFDKDLDGTARELPQNGLNDLSQSVSVHTGVTGTYNNAEKRILGGAGFCPLFQPPCLPITLQTDLSKVTCIRNVRSSISLIHYRVSQGLMTACTQSLPVVPCPCRVVSGFGVVALWHRELSKKFARGSFTSLTYIIRR